MDAFDCVMTKLDVRDYSTKKVPGDIRMKILEAGRMTGSGMNRQHWKFILVQERGNLKTLSQDSTTGRWIEGADFAIIILTNPEYGFHLIDAGRAAQNMQVAAWNYGVVSCVFTGVKNESLRRDFKIPEAVYPSIILGFGYPARKLTGRRKDRKPLREITALENWEQTLDPKAVGV